MPRVSKYATPEEKRLRRNQLARERYARNKEKNKKKEEEEDRYMNEDMGECPKCDCPVKRKNLAWRIGYYLDICAKCDKEEAPKEKIQCVVCEEQKATYSIGFKCKTCKNSMCQVCCCEYHIANPNKFDFEGDETGYAVDIFIPCPMCRTINAFCV